MKRAASSYLPLVALLIIFVFLGIFLFSYDQYPIDDDWSYIKAAESFHHTGEMKFTPWTAMSLVFQIWWGACFTKLFGYSIEMLRVSILAISLLGFIFIYLLLRELGHTLQTSLLAVLVLLCNPFSFPLMFTFFTDQSFIALLVISTYFFYVGFKDENNTSLLIASLVSACTVLVRQNGILIPLSVFVYLVLRERSLRTSIGKGLLILGMPLAALIGFSYWLNVVHGAPSEYVRQVSTIVDNLKKPHLLIIKAIWRPVLILEFIGFCLIPLSFGLLPRLKEIGNKKQYFFFLLFCCIGTLFYLLFDHVGLPATVDLWINGFRFAYISEYGYRDFLSIFFFFNKVLDVCSLASIAYLVYLLAAYRREIWQKFSALSPPCLILFIGLGQALFLLVTLFKFSRYFLTLVPFFLIVVLEITRHITIQKKIVIPLLAGYLLFSLAAAQDMMSWNQCKWGVARQLLDKGITPQKISAGFAWDAWHSCEYSRQHPYEIVPQRGDIPWWIEDLVPTVDPQYLVSNSTVPTGFETYTYFNTDSYAIVDSSEYPTLFYPGNQKVYVMERISPGSMSGEGLPFASLLNNLKGIATDNPEMKAVEPTEVSVDGVTKRAWVQPAPSRISFRMQLPGGRSRLKASLGVMPSCWDGEGDGIFYKIMINDILLENFFGVPGAVGFAQVKQFLRPRTFFLPPRTYFVMFIDPKNNPAERKWHDIDLDLSSFAGKVVDIIFEVSGGPLDDNRCDEALWGNPVIELY